MAFDRSKYKATSVAAAKQADQEIGALTGKEKALNADYLNVKDGTGTHNYRIYPPHLSDEGVLYAVAKGVHWIPCMVPSKDKQGNFIKDKDDKLTLVKANRPVFNAKIHAGASKDLIEEYVAFASIKAKEIYSTEKEQKAFMEPINGGFDSEYDGILLRQTWAMYVDELLAGGKKLFGRLEIGKAIKERLNKIAATESSSEPLGTDPFTDLEDGRAITIVYDKNAKKAQDYYSTEIYAPVIAGSKGQITLFPLSDDDMTKFETYPSLKKMFIGVYDFKTFDLALKGLKMFDDEFELGIFAYEDWLDIVETLSKDYPEVEGEVREGEEEESGDKFDKMDRDELKDFNREEKLGIVPNKSITDQAFRDLIRLALENKKPVEKEVKKESKKEEKNPVAEEAGDLPWDSDGKDIKAEEVAPGKIKTSMKERLEKLKKK